MERAQHYYAESLDILAVVARWVAESASMFWAKQQDNHNLNMNLRRRSVELHEAVVKLRDLGNKGLHFRRDGLSPEDKPCVIRMVHVIAKWMLWDFRKRCIRSKL